MARKGAGLEVLCEFHSYGCLINARMADEVRNRCSVAADDKTAFED